MTCILLKSVTWKLSWKGMEEKRWQILSFLIKWREVQMLLLWFSEDCLRQDSNLKTSDFTIRSCYLKQVWFIIIYSTNCVYVSGQRRNVPHPVCSLVTLGSHMFLTSFQICQFYFTKLTVKGTFCIFIWLLKCVSSRNKKKIYFSWTVHFHWCGSNVFKLVQFLFQP